MTDKIIAHAKVQVIIEVSNVGSWGGECSIDQVVKQAAESAIGRIRNLKDSEARSFHIIGEPKVLMVWTE